MFDINGVIKGKWSLCIMVMSVCCTQDEGRKRRERGGREKGRQGDVEEGGREGEGGER